MKLLTAAAWNWKDTQYPETRDGGTPSSGVVTRNKSGEIVDVPMSRAGIKPGRRSAFVSAVAPEGDRANKGGTVSNWELAGLLFSAFTLGLSTYSFAATLSMDMKIIKLRARLRQLEEDASEYDFLDHRLDSKWERPHGKIRVRLQRRGPSAPEGDARKEGE